MADHVWHEEFIEERVTYTLEINGELIVIENVPARVSVQTGERLFSPQVVERIQKIVWEKREPNRVMEIPVYEYAA